MKNTIRKIVLPVSFIAVVATQPVMAAEGSLQNLGKASEHSVQALGHGLAAGGQLVSGVVAVPLKVVGAVGEVSGKAGDALWNISSGELPVTDETITASPSPSDVMNEGDEI